MKRYEKIALALMAPAAALVLLMAGTSDGGGLAPWLLWPGAAAVCALLTAALGVVKRGWERDTGKKAVLFFDLSGEDDNPSVR